MAYLIHIAILASLYSMLALSLNLVVGEAGLLSVTQAAFMGIGAYTVALLTLGGGMNFFLALLIGVLLSGLVALLLSVVFSRLSGDYYALGTFGFNIIIFSVMLNWQSLTNGPLGVPGIPRPELLGYVFASNLSFLVLSLVMLAAVYGTSVLITRSAFGRVLHGIREDEEAIAVFGYHPFAYKLVIFTISGMLAAVAGGLFASYLSYIDPSSFQLTISILILAMVILGGLSSHRGAVLGAVVLIVFPELLRFVGFPDGVAAQLRQTSYGLLLILLMLYRPQGILGTFKL
jgi:branched-chain amino acid transport system permease protein